MIRSRQNPTIRRLRRARRGRDEHALLEGPDLIGEATGAGIALEAVLATADFLASAEARALQPALTRQPLEVAPELLDELADADSPRGVVALARLPRAGVAGLPVAAGATVYVDRVQNPANLGALARVAEAAGALGLALAPGSVHPNHPRALRASAGSLLRLPVAVSVEAPRLAAHLASHRPTWVALTPAGGEPLWQAPLPASLILAVGAEGPGLSPPVRALAERSVQVPMAPPVESLNVVVAAALVLFELRRRAG